MCVGLLSRHTAYQQCGDPARKRTHVPAHITLHIDDPLDLLCRLCQLFANLLYLILYIILRLYSRCHIMSHRPILLLFPRSFIDLLRRLCEILAYLSAHEMRFLFFGAPVL